jgi:Ca2+-dependent lipid-binding protein
MHVSKLFSFISVYQGVLRVHVVEAKQLMKKDISVLGKGKSDPYVVITVGAQEFRSQTINNSVNPKWDFWCEVSLCFCAHRHS